MIDLSLKFINEFWIVLCQMAPYLLLGFFIAGILSVLISEKYVRKHLGKGKFLPILKATLLGVPLPLCSCGVIPVAASLRRSGAGKGATTSFLISTPQTGVDSILVTYSLLGPVFAVVRPIAALLTGLAGGFIASVFDKDQSETPISVNESAGNGHSIQARLISAFRYGFVTLPSDINRTLIIGLGIAGLIATIVPNDFFSDTLGPGLGSMIVMMLLGIPVYVCATASVPIAAALILKGVSPGAAFVFLLTGPATNAATISTIWKIMGKIPVIVYVSTVAVSAIISGLMIDSFFPAYSLPGSATVMEMNTPLWQHLSGILLLIMMANAAWGKKLWSKSSPDSINKVELNGMKKSILIEGMNCTHCSNAVQQAISEMSGVEAVTVNLNPGEAIIQGKNVDELEIEKTIEQLGYKIKKPA